jgi:hypothetical protein
LRAVRDVGRIDGAKLASEWNAPRLDSVSPSCWGFRATYLKLIGFFV